MTKTCTKCGAEKPRSEFNRKSANADGLYSRCKPCHREDSRKDYAANKPERRAKTAEWQQGNREAYLQSMRRWREANPEKFRQGIAEWKERNPDHTQKANREWYEANAEYAKAQARKWAKDNPEKAYARNARRRAREASQALPLTQQQQDAIKHLYAFAKYLTNKFGTSYHVDHIVPLKGKEVSGLHVPWNLQILSAKRNLSKSNKLDL
jgi:hypothetical protein